MRLQDSFFDLDAIERARTRVLTGTRDLTTELARRMAAAELGRRIRPYFAVARLASLPDAGSGAGILPNGVPVQIQIPGQNGFPKRTAIYGAMTDAQRSTALFNIVRRRNLAEGIYEQNFLSSPQRALYFAGDTLHGALRIGPAEWYHWPEPEIYEKGEPLNLIGQGDGADSDVSKCFFTFYGEQERDPESEEGELTSDERAEITRQIRNREQTTGVARFNVDYTLPETYTEVRMPILERWSLLCGFASSTATASSSFLRWSTVDIQDARGQKLSNEPIPIGALCAYPFDASNTQVWYRKLVTPYLLAPGDYRRLIFTFAKRTATGAGEYPASVTADTVGKVVAVIRTA